MTPFEIVTCVVLVLISAYMAAAEIALFSLSRFQIRSFKETSRVAHRRIRRLLQDPGGLLITILVVNETLNIALSTIITGAISRHGRAAQWALPGVPAWAVETLLGILVTAPIVLFCCEITPKTLAARANRLVATLTVGPLGAVYDLLRPVRWLLERVIAIVSNLAARRVRTPAPTAAPASKDGEKILRESDFLMMIEEGHREGSIGGSEFELIKNVFELDDTPVSEVMTPLSQVQSLISHTTVRSALAVMRGQRFSRIPVTSPNKREVVGVLYSKDLLRAKLVPSLLEVPIVELMRKPLFVSPSTRLNPLFRRFKRLRTHMAVVTSGKGDGAGETPAWSP